MGAGRIRVKAVMVVRDRDRILVSDFRDTVKGETFWLPPGGGVDFGERAMDAARREFMEEVGEDVSRVRLLSVFENIFTYEGQPGHEILFAFECVFADPALCEKESFLCRESNGKTFTARWRRLSDFARPENREPLYPEGLLDALLSGRSLPSVGRAAE